MGIFFITENKCGTQETNFYYCLEKVQDSFDGKRKMELPNWLKTLNAKDLNILNTHMQLLRSKFA
jgi:hypothetical protein